MLLELEKIKFPPEVAEKGPSGEAEYLKEGNMKGRFLGQCLDSCRWGSPYDIMYEMNSLEMTEFVKNWIEQNPDNLRFHYKELSKDFELPYIDREVCPINEEHKLRGKGLDGTIRCINEDIKRIKEGYLFTWKKFDSRSNSVRTEYSENRPFIEDEEAWEEYKNQKNKVTVLQRCGAILSDRGAVLPLAEILDRLNEVPGGHSFCKTKNCADAINKELDINRECFGHIVYDHYVLPFDGWYLAKYVQKWYEQLPKGTAPFTTPSVTDKLVKKTTTPDRVEVMKKKWNKIL